MKEILDADSKVVHSPKFDSAIIKVLNGNEESLDDEEKQFIGKLINNDNVIETDTAYDTVFNKNSHICSPSSCFRKSKYIDLKFISPTYNIVKRLFSLAKKNYYDDRKSLDNSTLEYIIFLNQNKKILNENIVDTCTK